ncbi:jg6519 [Pararge aegeria aegeria]|uniref:Jg6519 protein n=1 Tax=Pararge aegeria aegeria TaxID=348720 RepID=A0A8S4S3A9_9NEOP|nr:jg6519 [Pararge aegeria aegeria]
MLVTYYARLATMRSLYIRKRKYPRSDQIQPNQTILINHQNTPPWIQNRQMQNQVIYVQHVPTNYMPTPQQHIDQNQLYIQNYGYQNMQQMFVPNPQEQIRPLQIMPNMMTNMQPMPPNMATIQNPRMVSNVAPMSQQVNIVNAQNQNNSMSRMMAPNQINPNELINKPQEIQVQNIYRHQMPQTVQQEPRYSSQPTITMVPNSVQNNIQRVPQTFEQNVNQIRPVQQNVASNIQQAYPNTIFNVDETRKVNTANKGTSATNFNIVNPIPAAKNIQQTYRPIQPRTNQVRSNAPNLLPMQPSTSIQAQHTMPNIISMNNVPRKIMPNSVPVSNVNTTLSNLKVEGNNFLFNRKRKSESPDEVHRRVTNNNQTEAPVMIKQIQNESYNTSNSADVGVNTSPIHRPSGRITINNMQIIPLNSNSQNSKLIEELAKPVRSNTLSIQMPETTNNVRNMINIIPESLAETQTDKEKLIRNTVYVQARGRILTDKDNVPEPPKIETVVSNPEPNIVLPVVNTKTETTANNTDPHMPLINEPLPETSHETIKEKTEIKKEIDKEIPEVKKDIAKTRYNLEDSNKSKVKVEIKSEITTESESTSAEPPKEVIKLKTESKPNVKVKAETSSEVKEERGYILTHVLGGFVIQESNIAFPIRKPLKEKTFYNNSEESKKENKDSVKRDREFVKDNSKILDISHLNIKECENMEAEADECKTNDENENPFSKLAPSDVRTWTAEQLAAHLAKYNWSETVSVLQDHELDGESLSLVSKAQLVTIGVKEEHAEIICEFVKS